MIFAQKMSKQIAGMRIAFGCDW